MPNWEEIQKEWETTKITFKALAEKHDVKKGTLKSRRSREKWSRNKDATHATNQTDATVKNEKDATKGKTDDKGVKKNTSSKGKRKKQSNRSGNPNPVKQFTKRNSAAVTHGFFSKFLPAETMEIMEQMKECSPADLIYDQIQIQYAAIIRAQQIMFVEDKDDITKVLKKKKPGMFGDEKEWEFQFAWDKQANFMNAQSRAMGEFRSLIRQFTDMAHEDDERRLRLEQLQVGINKTNAEIENLQGDNNKDGADDWKEALLEVAKRRRELNEREQ